MSFDHGLRPEFRFPNGLSSMGKVIIDQLSFRQSIKEESAVTQDSITDRQTEETRHDIDSIQ